MKNIFYFALCTLALGWCLSAIVEIELKTGIMIVLAGWVAFFIIIGVYYLLTPRGKARLRLSNIIRLKEQRGLMEDKADALDQDDDYLCGDSDYDYEFAQRCDDWLTDMRNISNGYSSSPGDEDEYMIPGLEHPVPLDMLRQYIGDPNWKIILDKYVDWDTLKTIYPEIDTFEDLDQE